MYYQQENSKVILNFFSSNKDTFFNSKIGNHWLHIKIHKMFNISRSIHNNNNYYYVQRIFFFQ